MSSQFQPYFDAIAVAYEQWWERYTLTDAQSKSRSKQSAPFDFGLMVQTVKEERQPEEEEVEHFPVLEGIRKYAEQHVLLVGRPGSGKSTALARLLLEEATNPQAKIPVLVELRYWQGSIKQLIRDAFNRHEMPAELVEVALKNVLILFDGVNELPSEEARSQLSAFRRNHPKLPMIFTTRDLSLGGDLGIEKRLEMQPLSKAQMQDFIRAYIPEQADQMLRQLKGRLREFGQTPLLLWMLCGLFQQTGTVPENLGLVFREFTQGYERYLKEDVWIESDRAWWKPVLQQLAWVMMQGEKPTESRVAIRREEAIRAIAQFLDGKVQYAEDFSRKCLRDLQKHHLIQAGKNHEELEFRHQLIQEYYAAEWLLEQLQHMNDETLKFEYLNYLKWTEPVSLMLALVESEVLAMRVVKLSLSLDLMLGARLAGEVRLNFQEKTIELLNQVIEEHKLPTWLKIELWGEGRSKFSLKPIMEIIEQDVMVRERAISALSKLEPVCVISHLAPFVKSTNPSVRRISAHLLGLLGKSSETTVVPDLLKLAADQNRGVRRSAAHALGEFQSNDALTMLLKLIRDIDFSVRRSAAFALSKVICELEHEGVLRELLLLANDSDSGVRRTAILIFEKLKPELKKTRMSPDFWEMLVETDSVATDSFLSLLPKDLEKIAQDNSIQQEILNVFRVILIGNAKQFRNYHRYFLFSGNADFDVLIHEGSNALLYGLLRLSSHYDSQVRSRASKILDIIARNNPNFSLELSLFSEKCTTDVEYCLKVIESKRPITILEYINERIEEGRALYTSFLDEIYQLREVQLSESQQEQICSYLLKLLDHEDFRIRESVAHGLGKLRLQSLVTKLIQLLQHEDLDTAARAAYALSQMESEQVNPELIKLLESEDPNLRAEAEWLLEKINLPKQEDSIPINAKRRRQVLRSIRHGRSNPSDWSEIVQTQTNQMGLRKLELMLTEQRILKLYNYNLSQTYQEVQTTNRQTPQNNDRSSPKINQFPNVTEVKIFENVDRYYETPPKDPPS